jgi:hypothetical protein
MAGHPPEFSDLMQCAIFAELIGQYHSTRSSVSLLSALMIKWGKPFRGTRRRRTLIFQRDSALG